MAPRTPKLAPAAERALARLKCPEDVQALLDDTPYSSDPFYRAPVRVLADRRAHCVDGALLAALALSRQGHPPLVLDMRAERDDDHVIALYRRREHWGAVAKSNVVCLRYREPIYRTLRELVMSYFEFYFNTDGEKALRSYSSPVDLRRFDRLKWQVDDAAGEVICEALDRARHHALVSQAMIASLSKVDERTYRAGLLGADPAGLFAADRLKL
jgi:hypothetical protein